MSCLIIKNDGIGDLVLSSGVISSIAKIFNGNLDLVTCEQNREIAENIEGVKNIFYVSRDGLKFHPLLKAFRFLKPVINKQDLEIVNILK